MTVDALQEIVASLRQPGDAGPIELLLELWQHDETRIVCRRPRALEFHPDMAVRIRGAFGRALAELPPPVVHRHDPFSRPPAFKVLWEAFRDEVGRELPKPFVIDVDIGGNEIIVVLRVFGLAQYWAGLARDALLMALDGGVSIKTDSKIHVQFEPLSWTSRRVDGLDCPRIARDAVLLLSTPLAVRHGSAIGLSARSLFHSAFVRASGLARWQGLRLLADSGAIGSLAEHMHLEADALFPVRFSRHSRRQPGREIPVMGLMGRLGLQGPLEALTPYLAIGAVAHIGSHAALGLGRYDLLGYG